MTREIKFRMWSEEAVKYFSDPQVFECLMQQYCHDNNAPSLKHDHIGDGMVFEQYTGLKDKNGKEIYEGDIVRNFWTCKYKNSGKPPTYTVVFKDGCFQFWAGSENGNYKCVSKIYWPAEHCKPENWEIIGNIHENPELVA